MKRVAIIGNSHVTALKHGLRRLSKFNNAKYSIDFFAAPARLAHKLVVKRNHIIPTDKETKEHFKLTSAGLSVVNLNSYDLIWIYGLTRPLDKMIRYEREVFSSQRYSKAVIASSFVERTNVGCKIASEFVDTEVVITPRPVPSSRKFSEPNLIIDSEAKYKVFQMLSSWFQFKGNVSFLANQTRLLYLLQKDILLIQYIVKGRIV